MIILFSAVATKVIFDFDIKSDIMDWKIVDDVVMGGKSSSTFSLDDEGMGNFQGTISLKNNGGFSSVQYKFKPISVKDHTKIVLKLKGDSKDYQFRIKSNSEDYYWYIAPFSTSGKWQEIEISLRDMYPSFRGRKLDQPNFSENYIEEITVLIGNKKEEKFKLLIDKIELR